MSADELLAARLRAAAFAASDRLAQDIAKLIPHKGDAEKVVTMTTEIARLQAEALQEDADGTRLLTGLIASKLDSMAHALVVDGVVHKHSQAETIVLTVRCMLTGFAACGQEIVALLALRAEEASQLSGNIDDAVVKPPQQIM